MQLVKTLETASNSVALANVKMGMTGARLMTRAEYRKAHDLTRAESEKKHNEYLRKEGLTANANLSARIAKGELLITGIKEYESGKGQLSFIDASKVVDKAPSAAVAVAALPSKDEALALLGITAEQLAAMVNAGK